MGEHPLLSSCPGLDPTCPALAAAVRVAGHNLRSLREYLGDLPVLGEGETGPVQRAQIREAERFLADRTAWSDPDRFRPLEVPGLRGARVLATDRPFRDLVLLVQEEPVACIRSGLPLVAPVWRGRGLGALLVLISDLERGRFLCPAAYSVPGAAARRSAHALQVRIADGALPVGNPEGSARIEQNSPHPPSFR